MSKQPKRLTRKDKIEISRIAKREEAEKLRNSVAALESRVSALEAPQAIVAKPDVRPGRDYFGKATT